MTVTYWGNPRADGSGGMVFDAPTLIEARWESQAEELFDDKGKQFVSRAKVFVAVDLELGGYLYQGNSIATDPTTIEGAYPIKRVSKISNMRRTRFERKVWL